MTYAATYHNGCNKNSARQETTAIAPTVRRVHGLDAKTQRRKRDQKGQTAVRSVSNAADGFLRTSFLPRLEEKEPMQACKETAKTERDFYTSLSLLAEHYGIEPEQTKQYGYPYNIALALWDIKEKLNQTIGNWDCLQLVKSRKKAFLISEERYRTGTTLYYIPVKPLYEMLHDPMRKKAAQLLVSVCSYLYHIADIPYYRQECSYLYGQYEMLKEWVEQDEETDQTEVYLNELTVAEWIGDRMEQKLFNRSNLTYFKQRLTAFKPLDEFDTECQQLACDAIAIHGDFPNANIFRNIPKPDEAAEDESEYWDREIIGMEKYISFMADGKGWLFESLSETINNEFNEYGCVEEPTIIKQFNGSRITGDNLEFENRLFTLLDDLCYLLNNFKTTRR